jgi:uncharacterized protein (TIGR02266 family)
MSETRPRILVVDDAPLFRELEGLYLSRLGEIRVASSGREARAVLETRTIDVVVLDLHLPDEPGDALCRELAPTLEGTRWLIVTGPHADEHARAVRAGACDVLSKPLARSELVAAVGRLVTPGPLSLPRAPLREPAHVWAGDRVSTGTVQNVSRGGFFLASGWLPREGTELRVEFALPGEARPLAASGRVVWRRASAQRGSSGFGVRFLELAAEAQRALGSYVQDHALFRAPAAST